VIERLIYTALTNGITELTENPERLLRFFEQTHQLTTTEAEAIQTLFLDEPPEVIHSYAREEHNFPLYAIVLSSEQETGKFLGDYGGFVTFAEAQELADLDAADSNINSSVFSFNFDIMVYTKHPDVAVYYYHLAKYFMIRARDYFKSCNVFDMVLGGSDVAPDPRYIPENLFVRVLRVSCQQVLGVIAAKEARAFAVDGLHISVDGATTIGCVKSLVTVSEE
jgi:hypothetical protein